MMATINILYILKMIAAMIGGRSFDCAKDCRFGGKENARIVFSSYPESSPNISISSFPSCDRHLILTKDLSFETVVEQEEGYKKQRHQYNNMFVVITISIYD